LVSNRIQAQPIQPAHHHITHRYPLAETIRAFEAMRARDSDHPMWMVVVTP
jgi:hypothetical protein